MNDNLPQQLASYPLDANSARHLAGILANADGKHSLERLLGELGLLPGYEVVHQDNGMASLSRLGGEESLLLVPSVAMIPMLAQTILKFMVPSALHAQVKPGMSEAETAFLLSGGKSS
ncbi:MAG: hypothetical protein HQL45_11520 [Alphaproteobacteria bacterium]|nr:hypothetical protein [Alphaproteobacteria bacterium]